MREDSRAIGKAQAIHQPSQSNSQTQVTASICDKMVPPAAQSILGRCEYYYRPLHNEYVEKTGVSSWEIIKNWAQMWNPFDDDDIHRRLILKRDKLIRLESSDDDWSRHASFMIRHIGCGHKPPDYYVSYGYYYCSTYGEKLAPRLSPAGKKWLATARMHLQGNMEMGLDQNMIGNSITIPSRRYPNRSVSLTFARFQLEISKESFKVFAFKTHVPAYLDAGLADLSSFDLLAIGGQPNIEEWFDKATWEQAIDSGTEVSKNKVKGAADTISDAVESALKGLINHLSF